MNLLKKFLSLLCVGFSLLLPNFAFADGLSTQAAVVLIGVPILFAIVVIWLLVAIVVKIFTFGKNKTSVGQIVTSIPNPIPSQNKNFWQSIVLVVDFLLLLVIIGILPVDRISVSPRTWNIISSLPPAQAAVLGWNLLGILATIAIGVVFVFYSIYFFIKKSDTSYFQTPFIKILLVFGLLAFTFTLYTKMTRDSLQYGERCGIILLPQDKQNCQQLAKSVAEIKIKASQDSCDDFTNLNFKNACYNYTK